MIALKVENLKKVYPKFILDNVSFEIKKERIAGLLGRNGAGKSTILKALMNILPSEGRIEVLGRDARADENEVKQLIGFVNGGFGFYPLKKLSSVRKSYELFYPNWSSDKYENYLKLFNLDETKKVKELSEGMKVKFALALALSHGAELLILDEPTSGLDPVSREELLDIMLALVRDEKVTVLFSTHITSDLMRIADDIIYISEGKLLESASLNEILSKYYLARFSSIEEARKFKVIGLKSVKDGYEGLLKRDSGIAVDGVSVGEASIDHIMIHLEAEKKGGLLC